DLDAPSILCKQTLVPTTINGIILLNENKKALIPKKGRGLIICLAVPP
ncbi:hypothetical protein BB14905_09535, partial [Bacillus sp. B14905]